MKVRVFVKENYQTPGEHNGQIDSFLSSLPGGATEWIVTATTVVGDKDQLITTVVTNRRNA